MKATIRILIIAAFLASLLVPFFGGTSPIAYAEKPLPKINRVEHLAPGQMRLDKNTVATQGEELSLGEVQQIYGKEMADRVKAGEVKVYSYTSETTSLPTTMSDLTTRIVCEWREGMASDGVTYFENGNNLYYTRVTNTRVSLEYEDVLTAWDPQIYVGGTELPLVEGPTVINDPLNENYFGNVIRWKYSSKVGGFFGLGSRTVTIERFLRQVEGSLQEFYVLSENPKDTLKIVNNYVAEGYYPGTALVGAFDANQLPIVVTGDKSEKIIDSREFNRQDIEYPVTIDPTTSFATSTYDGWFSYVSNDALTWSGVWAGARTASSSRSLQDWWTTLRVGFWGYADPSHCAASAYRSGLFFDTSSLPDDATVTAAALKFTTYQVLEDFGSFTIVAQNGGSTYPHTPMVAGDYSYTLYSGNGGTISSGAAKGDGYHTMTLTTLGKSWISLTGSTKFLLREGLYDVTGTVPPDPGSTTKYSYWAMWSAEIGSGYQPLLEVTYTLPVVLPTVTSQVSSSVEETSATLQGYLSSDGGAACSVNFKWGLTGGYGQTTAWQDGKTTGTTFTDGLTGLEKGTIYHWAAQAMNSAPGSSTGSDKTFLTKPDRPSGFTVTPGSSNNTLAWTKGTGSDDTMVRFSTSSYPNSRYSGTQIYLDDGASFVHTSLTNGVTYYYSIFGVAEEGGFTQYSDEYRTAEGTPAYTGNPTGQTNPATNVQITTATLNGYLTSLGGSNTDCWFQYYWGAGTWTDHETASVELTVPGGFTKAITTLPTGTLIHQRAAMQNDEGTTYGSDITFTTGVPLPTVVTNAATAVGYSTATLQGTIASSGGEDCEVRFQYGETDAYGTNTTWVPGYGSAESFSKPIAELDDSTLYHYRAQARNAGGIGNGTDANFTTTAAPPDLPECTTDTPTSVGYSTAILHGTVIDDGGESCEIRFVWGLTDAYGFASTWLDGRTTGSTFSEPITDLSPSTTYHLRAEIRNGAGSGHGDDINLTTTSTPSTIPVIATSSATSIGYSSATLNSVLTSGGGETCEVKFEYGLTDVYGNSTDWVAGYATGSTPYVAIAGLDTDTTYHFRALAKNSAGTGYGGDLSFVTEPPTTSAPAMTTTAATGMTKTAGTMWGTVTNDGSLVVTAWFEWGETTAYGHETSTATGLWTSDQVYISRDGLTPGTTYHYRVVGENLVGKGYGLDQTLVTTSPTVPTVTTNAATGVSATGATLRGTLTTDGGVECEVQFQYGEDTSYGNNTGWMPEYLQGEAFEYLVSNVTSGGTYHFRAQAQNSAGIGNGTDLTFATVFGAPTNFVAVPLSRDTISVTWVRIGDQTLIIGKVGSFPADRLDGEQVYFGAAEGVSHTGLVAGTTYFYRAWSWKSGGTWSDYYAEDAATTTSGAASGLPEYPPGIDAPDAPHSWWAAPSGDNFVSWPGYGIVEGVATDLGIPSGSMWLIMTMIGLLAVGIGIYVVSGSVSFTIIGIGLGLGLGSAVELVPLWIAILYLIIAGASAWALSGKV